MQVHQAFGIFEFLYHETYLNILKYLWRFDGRSSTEPLSRVLQTSLSLANLEALGAATTMGAQNTVFGEGGGGGGDYAAEGIGAVGGSPGPPIDVAGDDYGLLRVFVAFAVVVFIPLAVWLVRSLMQWLTRICGYQIKPSLSDCEEKLSCYYDHCNEATGRGNIYFGYHYDDPEGGELTEVWEDQGVSETPSSPSSCSLPSHGAHRLHSHPHPSSPSLPLQDVSEIIGTTQHRSRQFAHRGARSDTGCRDDRGDKRRRNGAKSSFAYRGMSGFLRGNFTLFVQASASIGTVVAGGTLATWILGTNPVAVMTYMGIAWASLWFQSGISGLFGNYLAYLCILIFNKYQPGSLIYVPGQMDSSDVACVNDIDPLWTEVMLIKAYRSDGYADLRFRQIPNSLMFLTSIDLIYKNVKIDKIKVQKIGSKLDRK